MTISSSYKDDSHLLLWNTSWALPDQKNKGRFALQVDAFVSVDTMCQHLDAPEIIIMPHVWWEVILSMWVTGTTLIKVPLILTLRSSSSGTKRKTCTSFHASFDMTPSGFGWSTFLCVCVCLCISGSVFEESDRFRVPLGLCHLSVGHILFFLHAIHLAHMDMHTLCWITCHADL